VGLLNQQIDELKLDKAAMREQITQFTQTLQQNNVLQQQLHTLLKGMQERLLPQPEETRQKGATTDAVNGPVQVTVKEKPIAAEIVDAMPVPPREPKASTKRKSGAKKSPAKKKVPKPGKTARLPKLKNLLAYKIW
jgi:chromosome segregation ATPase